MRHTHSPACRPTRPSFQAGSVAALAYLTLWSMSLPISSTLLSLTSYSLRWTSPSCGAIVSVRVGDVGAFLPLFRSPWLGVVSLRPFGEYAAGRHCDGGELGSRGREAAHVEFRPRPVALRGAALARGAKGAGNEGGALVRAPDSAAKLLRLAGRAIGQ